VVFTNSMELGDVRQAETWLDAGMPPDYMGSRIGSGLMIGAWEGQDRADAPVHLARRRYQPLNANGESAIALAAWRGHLEAVKWLLERGARINAPPRQWSALHYAVFAGHPEVANYLIEQGADINAQSTNGSSVLMMASTKAIRTWRAN
jgi:ankyrin repeat protein